MKSIGLAVVERKVSCSSANSTSSPFSLSWWPSAGAMRVHHRFPGCWVKSSVQVQNPSGSSGDCGTMFSPLGGIKVTQPLPQPELKADMVLSVIQNTGASGYITVHMQKVCVLDTTSLWAFFPFIYTRLHPLHTYHTCYCSITSSKCFCRKLNALNPLQFVGLVSVTPGNSVYQSCFTLMENLLLILLLGEYSFEPWDARSHMP